MGSQYYYADSDKKPQGPYEAAELEQMLAEKLITSETLVIREGHDSWVPYRIQFAAADTEPTVKHAEKSVEDSSFLVLWHFLRGLFLGTLMQWLAPAIIVIKSCIEIRRWGQIKSVPFASRRIFLSLYCKCAIHTAIFWIALVTILDVTVLIPVFDHSLLVGVLVPSPFASQIQEQISRSDTQDKLPMMFVEFLMAYGFIVPVISLIGELIDVLASVGTRGENDVN